MGWQSGPSSLEPRVDSTYTLVSSRRLREREERAVTSNVDEVGQPPSLRDPLGSGNGGRPQLLQAEEELAALRSAAHAEIAKIVLSHDDGDRADAHRRARRRARPARGAAGHGEDAARVRDGARPRRAVQARPVHARHDADGDHRTDGLASAASARFEPGIVFTNVLLADEINRTPPRTQAALLEAMQEGPRHGRTARRTGSRRRSSSSRRRTPTSTRASSRCPSRSSTASSSRSSSTYGPEEDELKMLAIPHRGYLVGHARRRPPARRRRPLPRVAGGRRRHVRSGLGGALPDQRRPQDARGYPACCSARARARRSTSLAAAKAKARLSGRDHVIVDDVAAMAPLVLRHRVIADAADPADVVTQAVEAALPAAVADSR